MQVQTPVALVDRNLDRRSSKMHGPTRAAAEAFVQYLFSPEAQAEFADSGFRCVEQKHMLYTACWTLFVLSNGAESRVSCWPAAIFLSTASMPRR